jgi:hypothetical protein
MIVYHGTTCNIDTFHPFTHFGTLKAAEERIEKSHKRNGTVIPVLMTMHNPLRVRDNGLVDAIELLYQVYDADGIAEDTFVAIDSHAAEYGTDDKFFQLFATALEQAGYDGIVYQNIEEDTGQDSYIILRSEQVAFATQEMIDQMDEDSDAPEFKC